MRTIYKKEDRAYPNIVKSDYTDEQLENMYLDYFNNFLSVERWCKYYSIPLAEGRNVINRGRAINHKN